MNLEALKVIIKKDPDILEISALENNVDENIIVNLARYVSENGYDKLSNAQQYHFNICIRHLIEDVHCSGYNDEFGECPTILDDKDLVEYYEDDGKFCESCEAEISAEAYYEAY